MVRSEGNWLREVLNGLHLPLARYKVFAEGRNGGRRPERSRRSRPRTGTVCNSDAPSGLGASRAEWKWAGLPGVRRDHSPQRLVLSLPELRKHEWVLVVNGLCQPGLSGSQTLDGDHGLTGSLSSKALLPSSEILSH
jgi:hypothetical protein